MTKVATTPTVSHAEVQARVRPESGSATPDRALPLGSVHHRLTEIPAFPEAPLQACGCGKHYERPVQSKAEESAAEQPLQLQASIGRPLPDGVRSKMERSFNHDFSHVRIHQGSAAESIGAKAFTRGTDIHFKPGTYDASSTSGQQLLGHELTHVVQQAAGRVAVPQGKGAPINADPHLEGEADRGGERAARGLPVEVQGVTRSGPVQRQGLDSKAG